MKEKTETVPHSFSNSKALEETTKEKRYEETERDSKKTKHTGMKESVCMRQVVSYGTHRK
jgi:hypothetical protein